MTREELISQAQSILLDLGMDEERSNDRSAMVFLALAGRGLNNQWSEATGEMYTTRMLMDWLRDELSQDYAPNTRETVRRFTLHQFVAGGLVEHNADDPSRPINSPKSNYRINPDLLPVLHSFGTEKYAQALNEFLESVETWKQQKDAIRIMNMVPVELPDGMDIMLSAGGQNALIKEMVEEFCPRYAPGGKVLYVDDADHSFRTEQEALLSSVGIEIPEHGKAPDLIVWVEDKQWLFLMEACSTHGPIDVIRKRELLELFGAVKDKIIFVSCFPDRGVMRQYLTDLAWETEVWCASNPDHMIHLDGKRFMGPYDNGAMNA